MNRYFDFPEKRIVCELDIEDGTATCTAGIEAFRGYFKCDDVREVTKEEYDALSEEYQKPLLSGVPKGSKGPVGHLGVPGVPVSRQEIVKENNSNRKGKNVQIEIGEYTLKTIHEILLRAMDDQIHHFTETGEKKENYDIPSIVWELETGSKGLLRKTIYK